MSEFERGSANHTAFAHRTDRRSLIRAAGAGMLATAGGSLLPATGRAASARLQNGDSIATFPGPGTWTASPHTEISFRGATAEQLGVVTVLGSHSGGHTGLLMPHSDGNGVSFVPDARFEPTEEVTVRADVALAPTDDGALMFGVAQPAGLAEAPTSRTTNDTEVPPQSFRSRPDLHPPTMEVTEPGDDIADGYVFLGCRIESGQSGAMIADNTGEVIWFQPPANDLNERHDVRVQQYQGEPVITFQEGNGPIGYRLGHFVMLDSAYQPVAKFQIGNGYAGGDLHEFLLTPQGTALVGSYNPVVWDLSPVGGSKYGSVLDGVIQELDISTGRVLFEWHTLDHIALDESHRNPPSEPGALYDYVHHNSIGLTPDGNIVISGRHTFAIYKIDHASGEVIWRLNGKRSDFDVEADAQFSWQHDARMHENGELTLFDNTAADPDEEGESRGLALTLDEEAMTATMAREYVHSEHILSYAEGNTQVLPNGNVFVGWGTAPVFSEFTHDGELAFNVHMQDGASSYRAYRSPWTGLPADPPDIAAEAGDDGAVTVYASWNGATGVASWRVLAGPDAENLDQTGEPAARQGFETAIDVQTTAPYLAVQALDSNGEVLGQAAAIQVG